MKMRIRGSAIAVLCLCLLTGYSISATQKGSQVAAKATAVKSVSTVSESKITGLNPRGTPPPIPLIPMAPRPASLDGKTVYFVDDGFQGGDILLKEMIGWFSRNMPNVKTEFRKKAGGFDGADPKLWAEVKEKGDAMIMATGH
jgi:hypothetical protein